jgi:anaerobic selenocysteine-containing dehydrogenase
VFDEVSAACYGGISYSDVGELAALPPRADAPPTVAKPETNSSAPEGTGLRLLTYRPLFSGPAVERTPELQFQTPQGEIELTRADARARGIAAGDSVRVGSNGSSVALRAKIAKDLAAGTVRVADSDAAGLRSFVEVKK